jgi:hypothetical protein
MRYSTRRILLLIVVVFISLTLLLWGVIRLLAGLADRYPVTFGVSFSKYKAQSLGLDWPETYLAILDELKVKEMRLIAPWDSIEPEVGELDFADLDWQLAEAEKRGVKVLMAVGYKLPGWPECHVPVWAKSYAVDEQYRYFLQTLPKLITHLKSYEAIWAWQVENEPFFRFGDCPTWWIRKDFLEEEIAIVRSLDARPIVITESGEGDVWLKAAKRADIVGASMYRTVWNRYIRYTYPFTPTFYRAKAGLSKLVFGKSILMHEIQMEPWTPGVALKDFPLKEQFKTMSPTRFMQNIELVREIGFTPAYLWGVEWWFWAKNRAGEPFFWTEAVRLWN